MTDTIPRMRRFIVTNPNLSVGKPGEIVTADELRMDDAKLDQWAAAGYGYEVHGGEFSDIPLDEALQTLADDALDVPEIPDAPAGSAAPLAVPEEIMPLAENADGDHEFDTPFDPSEHSVTEVRRYMMDNEHAADYVMALERDGKNRSGIVNGW